MNESSNTGQADPDFDLEAWLRLLLAPGITPSRGLAALGAFGNAAAVIGAGRSALVALGLGADTISAFKSPDMPLLHRASAWLSRPGNTLLPIQAPGYPARLGELPGAPLALWLSGQAGLLTEPQLAIVGSRNPTHAGRATSQAFASHLASAGLVITSGLAEGIDTAAHVGALAAGGATVAVLGCGPDHAYPAANARLAARIVEHGLLVSEYPPGTPPLKHHFPARNRLISGLSLGVLVVEAAVRSGSLITARLAGEQGREVFAIPGSIHNPMARGCHRLIREGAKLVETGDDVLAELAATLAPLLREATPQAASKPLVEAAQATAYDDPDYRKLLSSMEFEPVTLDQLMQRTGLTTGMLSSMLLILELENTVETLAGGRYSRIRAPGKRA
jgi:DNA processing protein